MCHVKRTHGRHAYLGMGTVYMMMMKPIVFPGLPSVTANATYHVIITCCYWWCADFYTGA